MVTTVGRISATIDLAHPTNFYLIDALIAGDFYAFWDVSKHLMLPAIALGSIPFAIIARITRASVLDVQNEDYVQTTRRDCRRGSSTSGTSSVTRAPIVTIIGLQAGLLLSGAVLTRAVSPSGMGTWLVDAIKSRNTVVQGRSFVSLIFVLVDLLVDVAHAFINPRIRVS